MRCGDPADRIDARDPVSGEFESSRWREGRSAGRRSAKRACRHYNVAFNRIAGRVPHAVAKNLHSTPVAPAQRGIQVCRQHQYGAENWIPACAGTTRFWNSVKLSNAIRRAFPGKNSLKCAPVLEFTSLV